MLLWKLFCWHCSFPGSSFPLSFSLGSPSCVASSVVVLPWSLHSHCPLSSQDSFGSKRQTPIQIELNRTSLVVQWLRIRLPMQGTRVQALVREDPTCWGATKPMHYNYWACALEPARHNYWARKTQLLKPTRLEPLIHSKRSHCNEKPAQRNLGKPTRSNEDPMQPKINK